MATDLSAKQRRIYLAVYQWQEEHPYPASVRDIQESACISSTSVVKYNVAKLIELGLVEEERGTTRTIRIAGSRYILPEPAII